jgi:hypothetical protein
VQARVVGEQQDDRRGVFDPAGPAEVAFAWRSRYRIFIRRAGPS